MDLGPHGWSMDLGPHGWSMDLGPSFVYVCQNSRQEHLFCKEQNNNYFIIQLKTGFTIN